MPNFRISLFDYSGSLQERGRKLTIRNKSQTRECPIFSQASEGKGDIINYISNLEEEPKPHYTGIIDDDILIRVSDLNRAVAIGEREGLTSFQPSLAKCSHYSHEFTLNRANSIVRKVNWVEVMMLILKSELLEASKPFLGYSISSWGLDCYVFPMLAFTEGIGSNHAIIDASIAAHIRQISSGDKTYRNGLNASKEMAQIKKACQNYLVSRGIDWENCAILNTLLAWP